MSTVALNKLLEYILSLSLSNKNKDWLAEKIIMSKTDETAEVKSLSAEEKFTQQMLNRFSGAWHGKESTEEIIAAIKENKGVRGSDPLGKCHKK